MATIPYVLSPSLPGHPARAASTHLVEAYHYFLLTGKGFKRRVLITDLSPASKLLRL